MIREIQDGYQFDESSNYSKKSNESSDNNNESEFKNELSDIGFSHITIKITIKTTIKREINSRERCRPTRR